MNGKNTLKAKALLSGLGIIAIIIIAVVLVINIWKSEIIQNFLGQKRYESIADKAQLSDENEADTPYKSPIDFEYLWSINPEVVGYVKIPGVNDYLTKGYPILWSGDNDYYLHNDIDGKYSAYGAIYLDGDNKPDFSSLHNLTYGHHMKNGSMYRDIVKFKDKDFFDEHRDVYVYTPEKEYHLKTFACLYTDPDGERRRSKFDTKEDFDTYCELMTEGCSFRDLPSGGIKQLWSFVTCSYETNSYGEADSRTILYCYEVDEDGNKVEPDDSLYEIQDEVVGLPSKEAGFKSKREADKTSDGLDN